MESNYIRYKIILVGNMSVGKTSLLFRYMHPDQPLQEMGNTVCCDFKGQQHLYNGKLINMEIWDTSGEQKWNSMIKSYCNDVSGVLLLIDITLPNPISDINKWIEFVESNRNSNRQPLYFLIANKSDLLQQNELQKFKQNMLQQIKTIKMKYHCQFFITSAMKDPSIVFIKLFKQFMQKLYEKHSEIKFQKCISGIKIKIKNSQPKVKKKKKC